MNTRQLKERILIPDLLKSVGHEPVKRAANGDYVYKSPIRQPEEKTPSFHVTKDGRAWHDHGGAYPRSGSVIDLACYLFRQNVEGAVAMLNEYARTYEPQDRLTPIGSLVAVELTTISSQKEAAKPAILEKKLLKHPALVAYFEGRGIPRKLAAAYLWEIHYEANGKRYFSAGFENEKGGFELRNQYCKNAIGAKAATFFKGYQSNLVKVFEGFTDFLSDMVLYGHKRPECDVFVLNGLSQLPEIEKRLTSYQKINLFFDNDPDSKAGQRAAEGLAGRYPGKTTNQAAKIYPGHKDMNDYLLSLIAQKRKGSKPDVKHSKLNQNAIPNQ